jgi:uncharacterized membrane protein YqjE
MHTPTTERPAQNGDAGVGAAAKNVAEHASAIARLELQLAALELKQKVATLGVGIGMLVGAALFAFFLLALLLATVVALLDLVMPVWAALLVTAGIVLLVAAVLGLLGVRAVKKATPPVPEQAILEAKLTKEAISAR